LEGEEDQDFQEDDRIRKVSSGVMRLWLTKWFRRSLEAHVYDPEALLRGKMAFNHPTARVREIAKSTIAVPIYAAALPFYGRSGSPPFYELSA